MHNAIATPRTTGIREALALIMALTLPITPLLSMVSNLPQLFQHFGSLPHAGFLVPMVATMPSICIAVLSPFAGLVSDRIGRRRMLVIASAVYTIFGVLPFFFDSLYPILASLLVVGAAEAFIMSCGQALWGDYFEPVARKRWLGLQGVLGSVLATLIMLGGGTLGNLNWHAPFLINLLGALVFVWLLLFTWEPRPTAAASSPSAAPMASFPLASMVPLFVVTVGCGVFYFFQIEMGVFFANLGVNTPQAVSVITTIASLGVIIGGWYFRQQGARSVAFNIALIFISYAIGFTGVGLSKNYYVALPFAAIAQFGNGLFVPAFVGWALSRLAPEHRGLGMGLWTSCFFVCQWLSPSILALLAQTRDGHMLGAIFLAGLMSVVPAVWAVIAARRSPTTVIAAH